MSYLRQNFRIKFTLLEEIADWNLKSKQEDGGNLKFVKNNKEYKYMHIHI